MSAPELPPGLMVIHGNQPEALRELLVGWMRRHPLAPLEPETILVQSNGIAQWLKLALARDVADGGLGVAASLRLELPAQFLWRAYRGVLGEPLVPEVSALDKAPLAWRLMRLLPPLWARGEFEPLRRFLAGDTDWRRRHQLSEKLADLFDQYQVYRADWLADWAQGRDQLRRAAGAPVPLPPGQRWQAILWRELLADVGAQDAQGSRAQVHQLFVARLAGAPPGQVTGLPRRVVVFGISSMPAQAFEALAALSRHCQVLLCVHNPSRHHWADIVADKDLLRHAFKRHARRAAPLAGGGDAADAHQNAQPLLAAWGKQGRDYINMLDQFDDPASYRERIEPLTGGRIDLFDEPRTDTLLGQLQSDILELRTVAETRQAWPAVDPARDVSIRFHVAHSAQREVEVLHDQLLARLQAEPRLAPRDIIVMVPDINGYAPHIEAVFGQLAAADPRFIPYTLADRGRRGREPMLVALEFLLALPDSRLAASEILDLLDVAAVRRRLGLDEADLALLQRWIAGAGVRWGLDGRHRERLALPAAQEANSWRFGLRRMLLGFAVGQGGAWHGIEPYGEIGGLDAATLGPLAQLLDRIDETLAELAEPAAPADWAARLRALMDRFFEPATEQESLLRLQLLSLLDQWLADCERAGFAEPVPLAVVRESWLAGVDRAGLHQRFMAGAVSFCTLLPMRAIPFEVVCLLGMNDGDYPRQQPRIDFDLMQGDYRPGDRSRREDDRYLMLEALLSARSQLYVSWVGRSIRDNGERAPSVLVGQLRDHLGAGWRLAPAQGGDRGEGGGGAALLAALTQAHPLQPFSPRYFPPPGQPPAAPPNGIDGLYTYAHEWRMEPPAPRAAAGGGAAEALPPMAPDAPLQLRALAEFAANPVQAFFRQRLKAHLFQDEAQEADDEAFALDGLQSWQVHDELCERLRLWIEAVAGQDGGCAQDIGPRVDQELQRLRREGRLPLAAFGELAARGLRRDVSVLLERYAAHVQAGGAARLTALDVRHERAGEPAGLALQDVLAGIRATDEGWLDLRLLSGRLHEGKTYKWAALARHWVAHLALQLAGRPARTVLVSASGDLVLRPLPPADARAALDELLAAWHEGMARPLPVACRTACAWLAQADGDETRAWREARRVYEGDFGLAGEAARSPALARAYPGFDDLAASPQAFAGWARRLYGPLVAHLRGGAAGGAADESDGSDAAAAGARAGAAP